MMRNPAVTDSEVRLRVYQVLRSSIVSSCEDLVLSDVRFLEALSDCGGHLVCRGGAEELPDHLPVPE
jgi:hypothetical protein